MNWVHGFLEVIQGPNLLFLVLGTAYGLLIGALPGLGPNFGVASMLPLTYAMPPSTAIIFLAAIHAATTYGDSIASILINTPGGAGSIASCWDGHPLARKGRAGFALGISTAGSALGGVIGWISLVLVSPALVKLALSIGPAEYAAIAVLALSLLSVAARGQTVKGLILGGVGLLLSFVGSDPINGFMRYTFGTLYLQDGVELVPVTLGLFALAQAFALAEEGGSSVANQVYSATDRVLDGVKMVFKYPLTVIRSGVIGVLLGVMPALGISTANIVAYLTERRMSKNNENFGKGDPRGLLAPEVAKNACVVGDLVPTFTLGIPGSSTTALFLAALMIHGIAPGPEFFQKGTLPYTVFVGVLLAQLAFGLAGMVVAKYFAGIVKVSNAVLVPSIVVLTFVGAYGVRNELLDVLVTIVFGILGYILNKYGYPVACLVLGLVLGEMFEGNMHRALILGNGSFRVFITEPIALGFLLATVVFLSWPYVAPVLRGKARGLLDMGSN